MRFGESSFPLSLGGGRDDEESIHRALLDAYSPGFDVSDSSTIAWVEAYAEARVVSCGWAANKRLRNQLQPLKMCETLTAWEDSTRVRPKTDDPLCIRRAALAAKMRGLTGNTMTDIRDAVRAVAGAAYVGVFTTDPTNDITYWPGVNPGPPGYAWTSNRRTIRVQLTQQGVSDNQFYDIVSKLKALLDDMLPSDMSHGWYVVDTVAGVSGFFADISKVGITAV